MCDTVHRSYGEAIRDGFAHLLRVYPESIVIGQGLWSPWYVGNSMRGLEVEFGTDRVIDTPVSEQACTGAAVGYALAGGIAVVVHPRVDFMLLAVDQIVTQAAKWPSMFARRCEPRVLFRGIINRGGEQGAQHSQALHAWFAHVPGLRVVMPATPADARDLLVSGTLIGDPVMYIDDRWLYDRTEEVPARVDAHAIFGGPRLLRSGDDVTLVGVGYTTWLAEQAADHLAETGIHASVIDLRIINPLDTTLVCESVARTGRLLVVDGGWTTCGLAGEVIARVAETLGTDVLRAPPRRICLQDAPAPTSAPLEADYYPKLSGIVDAAMSMCAATVVG